MMLLALFFAIVFGVAILVGFAGWIWLVVRGFGKSIGWGLAMLFFSPIAAIVAAVRDWPEWKRPFLLYYGSVGAQILVIVVSLVAVPLASPFGRLRGDPSAQMEPSVHKVAASDDIAQEPGEDAATARAPMEDLPDPDGDAGTPIKPEPHYPRGGTDPTGRPTSASITEHVADPVLPGRIDEDNISVPDGYEEVAVSAAATRVGSRIRIVARDGRIHKGTLADVADGMLHVNFDVTGGSVAMDFAAGEIRSLQVRR